MHASSISVRHISYNLISGDGIRKMTAGDGRAGRLHLDLSLDRNDTLHIDEKMLQHVLCNIPVFLSSNPGSTTYYMGELDQVIY